MTDFKACAELLLQGIRFLTEEDRMKATQSVAAGLRTLYDQKKAVDVAQEIQAFHAWFRRMQEDCYIATASQEALMQHLKLIGLENAPEASQNESVGEKWPPLDRGTLVKTTTKKTRDKEWAEEALVNRKWGVMGRIIMHHDSHGLCYDVRHDDGTEGCYDPTEFEVLPQPKGVAGQSSK